MLWRWGTREDGIEALRQSSSVINFRFTDQGEATCGEEELVAPLQKEAKGWNTS